MGKTNKKKANYDEVFTKKNTITNIFTGHRIDVKFKTENQKNFYKLINEHIMTICSGIHGCGKTQIAVYAALEALRNPNNNIERIFLVKPNIEVGEKLGYLPGTVEEKIYMYMLSYYDVLEAMVDEELIQQLRHHKFIQELPTQFIRGRTLNNAFVIIDECQNMTVHEIKTLITRIGENSKYVLLGDTEQIDKKFNGELNGLSDALKRFEPFDKFGTFNFVAGDSVRHPIINELLEYYEKPEDKPKK